MTTPSDQPSAHTKRLAQAITVLGMSREDYLNTTVAEWLAICEEFNRQQQKK